MINIVIPFKNNYLEMKYHKILCVNIRSMIKRSVLFSFLLFPFSIIAQETSAANQSSGNINNAFTGEVNRYFKSLENIFKEKVYLHTDKPFYGAGDNIWYKGYLLNGLTYVDNSPTNYIYVELYNHCDSLIVRQKIRREEGQFVGNIEVPAHILPGNYYLRSYTSWMQNWDTDYFYQKNITIGNSISKNIESKIEFKTDNKNNYIAEITLLENGKPFPNKTIGYQIRKNDKNIVRKSVKSGSSGVFSISLDDLKGTNGILNFNLDDKTYKFKNSYIVPAAKKDFEVTFFPEGGNLLDGVSQNVAFKVQNSDGFSSVAKGYILENNDTILDIKTEHSGMGSFSFVPLSTEKYKAVIITEDNIKKEFNIEAPAAKGISLSVGQSRGIIAYKLNKTDNVSLENKYLIIQTRGKLLLSREITEANMSGQFAASDFPEGVIHFLIADATTKTPISERLIFVQHQNKQNWDLTMSKNQQSRRGLNEINLTLKDNEGNPLTGNFSVSITDAMIVKPDSLSENIRSSMLLSSELKGFIENPGYYINNNDAKSRRASDLLMMTHGWRKYADFNFAKLPESPEKHFIENGQFIAGIVKNATGSFSNKVRVRVWSLDNGANYRDTTNDKGEFFIQGIEFPDSTNFQLKASRFSGVDIPYMTIYPEEYYFPKSGNRNLYPVCKEVEMDDYLKYTTEKYYYEGGMKVFNLKEVEVNAKKDDPAPKSSFSSLADYTIAGKKIEENSALTLSRIIQMMPGIYSDDGETLLIRGTSGLPLILINDIQYVGDDGQQLITSATV